MFIFILQRCITIETDNKPQAYYYSNNCQTVSGGSAVEHFESPSSAAVTDWKDDAFNNSGGGFGGTPSGGEFGKGSFRGNFGGTSLGRGSSAGGFGGRPSRGGFGESPLFPDSYHRDSAFSTG